MSKKEKRQNLKVIQHDLVKKVFVRYPGLSLGSALVPSVAKAVVRTNRASRAMKVMKN